MNAYNAIQKVIETRFRTAWGDTTPIVYENITSGVSDEEYVRISIAWGGAEPHSIGPNNESREIGVIYVQVFLPAGYGSRRSLELAELVKPIFNEQIIEDLTDDVLLYCNPTGIRSVSRQEEGLFQLNAVTPFEFRRN